ncbi:membrane protein [Winslowiella iniecta]|uniref:Membrane protein n=2 Tax=Winslowiella iniecta TaxID=1560201 RepID=A0A0L7TI12_9GAMM|nr:membrane protein [Winslowiella iniecta]KOC94975.1 membrane protein [Winslowiella iniecta]
MFSKREAGKKLEQVQERSREAGSELCDELKSAASDSCDYLKKNPWAGVGIGAALGLVVGVLISKK